MIPWPSTDHTIQEYVEPLHQALKVMENAACAIQDWYRTCKNGNTENKNNNNQKWKTLVRSVAKRRTCRNDAVEHVRTILDAQVCVTPKYDGTCVGIEYNAEGFRQLVGRRIPIAEAKDIDPEEHPDNAIAYQKCNVRPLMEFANTRNIYDTLRPFIINYDLSKLLEPSFAHSLRYFINPRR